MTALSQKTRQLEPRVLQLRQRGLPDKQIAEDLGEPLWRIRYMNERLLRSGQTTARQRKPRVDLTEQEAAIAQLRASKLTNAQIAQALGVGHAALTKHVTKMLREKKLERRAIGRRGEPASRMLTFWRDPESDEFAAFVDLIRRGVSHKRIGRRYGRTSSRIGQIVREMRKLYGEEIFAPVNGNGAQHS